MEKLRIGILGLGGVGGYFGGLLAEKYYNSGHTEVVFIARQETSKIIKKNGLKLITDNNEKIIFPDEITDGQSVIRPFDLLVCCVKSYDLEESLQGIRSGISDTTVILPLLNGVDAKQRIEKIYPNNAIIEGCVYIVSQQLQAGTIQVNGNMHVLYFGSDTLPSEKLEKFKAVFAEAGIECYLAPDIRITLWEKFVFVSTMATLTSYLDLPIGPILENGKHREMLLQLLNEIKTVAISNNIGLPDDIIESTVVKMGKLPYEATTSMHRDFQKKRKTEYFSLSSYVSNLGDKLNIETPLYDKIVAELKTR